MQEDTEKKDTQYILVHNSGKIPKKNSFRNHLLSDFLVSVSHFPHSSCCHLCFTGTESNTQLQISFNINDEKSIILRLINQLGRCRVFSSQFFSTSSFPGWYQSHISTQQYSNVLGQRLLWIITFHPDKKDIQYIINTIKCDIRQLSKTMCQVGAGSWGLARMAAV